MLFGLCFVPFVRSVCTLFIRSPAFGPAILPELVRYERTRCACVWLVWQRVVRNSTTGTRAPHRPCTCTRCAAALCVPGSVWYARIPPTPYGAHVYCCWLLLLQVPGAPDAPPNLTDRWRKGARAAGSPAPAHTRTGIRRRRRRRRRLLSTPPPLDRRSIGGGDDGPVLPVRVPDAHNNWRASSMFASSARRSSVRDSMPVVATAVRTLRSPSFVISSLRCSTVSGVTSIV